MQCFHSLLGVGSAIAGVVAARSYTGLLSVVSTSISWCFSGPPRICKIDQCSGQRMHIIENASRPHNACTNFTMTSTPTTTMHGRRPRRTNMHLDGVCTHIAAHVTEWPRGFLFSLKQPSKGMQSTSQALVRMGVQTRLAGQILATPVSTRTRR